MPWVRVPLGEILSLEYGKALPARDRDSSGNCSVAGSNGPDGRHSEALVLGPGVVVGRKGSAGKVCWYETDFWPIDTTYYVVPKVPLELRWVYYLLLYLRLEQFRTTTGVPGLNRNDVYELSVPFPALPEQRRIVEILDQADHLGRLRTEADTMADRILPTVFHRMFGAREGERDVESLDGLLAKKKGALQSGPFGTHLHNHDFVPSGTVLAVGIDNVLDGTFVLGRNRRITSEKYEELSKYTLVPGDVLITIMGTVGRTCVFPETPTPAICTKHVYRIQVCERIHPEYLSAVLRFSQSIRGQLGARATGQIVAGIKSADLRRLRLPVPPIELQRNFARIKSHVDDLRARSRHGETTLRKLASVVLRTGFGGELTAAWRDAHAAELIDEAEERARLLSVARRGSSK